MGLFAAEVERLLQSARLHLGKGELHEAVGQANEVIRRDGKQPTAYLVRAEAHRRLNRPDRAMADLAVAIRLDPNQPGPCVIRAEILKRRNMFDQAIADATHALTLDPRNAAAFSIRAECRSAIGDVEGAGEDVQEMLVIDPTRPVPNLERRSSPPSMASDDQRFWKEAGPSNPKRPGDIFADGKPADRSLKSRKPVGANDPAEALVDASDYRPEVMPGPLPRFRARRKGPQVIPILAGLLCLGLLGGGYVLINQSRNSQDANLPKAQTQPSKAPTTAQSEPELPPTVATTPPAREEKSQPHATTSVSPIVQATTDRENPPTPSLPAAIAPSTATTVPSIEGSRRLEGHTGVVLGLAFSPDGKWLASASGDSTVRLWDVAGDQADNTHITLGTTGSPPPKAFINLAFSPDGKTLAASNMDGRIFLWDANVTPPKLLRTLSKHDDRVVAIAFSPDGKLLATGGANKGLVCIWDLTDPSIPLRASISPEKNVVWSLAFSPDGKLLFGGVSFPKPGKEPPPQVKTPGQIWVWDVSQRPYVKKSIIREVRSIYPRSIIFSPDGSQFAYGDRDVVKVVDLRTGRQVSSFEKHTNWVISIAYTPDGKYLLSGAYDKTARLWDAKTGKQVLEYGDATDAIEAVAVSPDGRLVAVAGHDKVIRLLRLRSVGDRQAGATIASPLQDSDSRRILYRFIEVSIDRDGSGKIVTDTRRVDLIDRDKSEEPGTAVPGLDGLKNAEITRLKDGRFRVIHDFQKIRDIEDLKSPFTSIDPRQHQIDTKGGVLVITPVPEQGFKRARLMYPRQLRLPVNIRYLILDYIEDGFIGVPVFWPKSVFNINLHGTSTDKSFPREVEVGWLLDLSKRDQWKNLLRRTEGTPLKASFQIPLTGTQADDRISPRIGVRTGDRSSSTLKIRRIEVVAHVVGKLGVTFDERAGNFVVKQLFEGAGARAGLRPGDQVLSLGGQEVKGLPSLMARLAKIDPGDPVNLNVLRDGKTVVVRAIAD